MQCYRTCSPACSLVVFFGPLCFSIPWPFQSQNTHPVWHQSLLYLTVCVLLKSAGSLVSQSYKQHDIGGMDWSLPRTVRRNTNRRKKQTQSPMWWKDLKWRPSLVFRLLSVPPRAQHHREPLNLDHWQELAKSVKQQHNFLCLLSVGLLCSIECKYGHRLCLDSVCWISYFKTY